MKYRIKEGKRGHRPLYTIQKKGWLFWDSIYSGNQVVYFLDLQEAKDFVKKHSEGFYDVKYHEVIDTTSKN